MESILGYEQLSGKHLWPDRLIYKQQEDDHNKLEIVLVYDKGNNRQMSDDKMMVASLLEQAGNKVRICYLGQLFTLTEFSSGAGYKLLAHGGSRQQFYNMRMELKFMEQQLSILDPKTPAFDNLRDKIARKKLMLESSAPAGIQTRQEQPTETTSQTFDRITSTLRAKGLDEDSIRHYLGVYQGYKTELKSAAAAEVQMMNDVDGQIAFHKLQEALNGDKKLPTMPVVDPEGKE